ncbi:MAG: hypothetical protein BWY75_03716 [bacterium ADurb.Bin425]|nr:MAG: hypothetical protein BWY75_03716 [bacterium ADurb.Bin425]
MFATGCDDNVFLPVSDADEAVFINFGYITCFEPAVFKSVGCGFVIFVIAAKDRVTFHQQFAIACNSHFHSHERLADRTRAVRERCIASNRGAGFG